MSGRGARRQANQAAEESRIQAAELQKQSNILKRRQENDSRKSQKLLIRALRAQGGGIFESDTLGATRGTG